jgi:hypothetical protein
MTTRLQSLSTDYTVRRGDNLYKIAKNHYGNPELWRKIAEQNKLKNPGRIFEGQKLLLPSTAKANEPTKNLQGGFSVNLHSILQTPKWLDAYPTEPTSPTTPEEKVPKCPAGYAQMCEVNCTAKAETNAECEDKLKKCLEDEAQYCKDNGAEIYPSFEDVPPSANRLSTSITPETELVKCSAPTRLCCAKKP